VRALGHLPCARGVLNSTRPGSLATCRKANDLWAGAEKPEGILSAGLEQPVVFKSLAAAAGLTETRHDLDDDDDEGGGGVGAPPAGFGGFSNPFFED
jgi:hypothetical protein